MGPGGLDSPRDPFSTPRGDWDLYFLYTKVGEKFLEISRESYSKKDFQKYIGLPPGGKK